MCRLWGYIADIAINYINKKMEGIMKKLLTQQFMGVLAGLASIILSVTLYAYKSDQNNIETQIRLEKEQRIESEKNIKDSVVKAIEHCDDIMEAHKKEEAIEREQLRAQYTQIQSDLTIIKSHLIND